MLRITTFLFLAVVCALSGLALQAPGAVAKTSAKSCKLTKAHRYPKRCRFREVVGRRGATLPANAGGESPEQYLPFDNAFPVTVSQGNSGRYSHNNSADRYGWDFAAPRGTTVRTAATGDVLVAKAGCAPTGYAGSSCNNGWGNTVLVKLPDGSCSRYGHLQSIAVAVGQHVPRYTPIGALGTSGSSTGPHLHFQRETCNTTVSLPSSFVEAGIPAEGSRVTSQNAPEPAPVTAVPPVQATGNPQQTGNPQPATGNPQPATGNPQSPPTDGGGAPSTFTQHVQCTCRDGACGLIERVGPGYSNTAKTGRVYPDGSAVSVTCQKEGEVVGPSPSSGVSSAVWDRLSTGGWVSDLYLDTRGAGTFTPPIASLLSDHP